MGHGRAEVGEEIDGKLGLKGDGQRERRSETSR